MPKGYKRPSNSRGWVSRTKPSPAWVVKRNRNLLANKIRKRLANNKEAALLRKRTLAEMISIGVPRARVIEWMNETDDRHERYFGLGLPPLWLKLIKEGILSVNDEMY